MTLTAARAILYGGLTAGVLDLLDAFVFFGLRSGARPMGILHSIAAGWLGRDAARSGGMLTATVGFFSHFLIAMMFAAAYVAASGRIEVLRRRWLVCGLLYGVAAYFTMTWLVVPLSNAGPAGSSLSFALPVRAVLINGLLIHAFGVGLPIAYFASMTRRRKRTPP